MPEPISVFQFSPIDYAGLLKTQGYVFIKQGITPEFLEYAKIQASMFQSESSLSEWDIKGKKQQCLLEFPNDERCLQHVFETIAALSGSELEKMTIAERHIKFYDTNAPARPAPHKDRLASQIAIGIPLECPEESRLVLYPVHSRSINPFASVITAYEGLDWENAPKELELNSDSVAIDTRPGDVVIFYGSSLYHERLNAAGSVICYLKLNNMRLDPIAEDPMTLSQRRRSLELLAIKSDVELLNSLVEVSPRLHRVSRHYTRLYWTEIIQIYVWGEHEYVVSQVDLDLLIRIGSGCKVSELLTRLGLPDAYFLENVPRIRRLGELGGIDFLS